MTPLLAHLTGAGGFTDGLLHPFTGIDHLATMALVGALAYTMRDRVAWWVLPAAFLGSMVLGGVAAIAGLPTPVWVETAIAGGVVLLALALLWSDHLTSAVAIAVGALAVAHGMAHGSEVPTAASPALYVVGFVAATASIHLFGAGIGRLTWTHRFVRQASAIVVAGVGLLLLTG